MGETLVLRARERLINRLLRADLVPRVGHKVYRQVLVLVLPFVLLKNLLLRRQVIVDLLNLVREVVMLLLLNLVEMALHKLPDGHLEALLSLVSL